MSLPSLLSRPSLTLLAAAATAVAPSSQESASSEGRALPVGQLIEQLADLVTEHYVFPDVAEEIAAHLRERAADGAYDDLADPLELAEALGADLRSVNGDKHFNVRPVPPGALAGHDEERGPSPEEERRYLDSQRRRNFGFERVEILEGNVGYLDLRTFADAAHAGPTAVAAMGFLANTDALIVDLRQNGGGNPSMVQLITTYFFDEPTHLNSFYWRGQEQIDQFWTLTHVPGPRRVETPLFVLTSSSTGSAAEEFTYNLKHLERATIVGETTSGAAHPGDLYPLGEGLAVFISGGRAINPITGTNWEGTGVEPHVSVPAPQALASAHLAALEAIDERLPEDADRSAVEWARVGLEAELRPVALPREALASLAGDYGPRRVVLRGDELYYSREGRPEQRLRPLTGETFALEGLDGFRLRFVRNAAGEVELVEGLYADGRRDASARDR